MAIVKELLRTEEDGRLSFGAVSYTHLAEWVEFSITGVHRNGVNV